MNSRRFASVAALAALAGCVAPPAYEKSDDPLRTVLPKARPFEAAKLCLLYTANTQKSIDHAREVYSSLEVYSALADRVIRSTRAEVHPRKLQRDINQLLNSRFRETVRIERLEESTKHGCDLTLALDVQLVIGVATGQEVAAGVTGSFIDQARRRIDTMAGARKSRVPFPPTNMEFSAVWTAALQDFGTKVDASEKIMEAVAGSPRFAGSSPAKSSGAAQLPAVAAGAAAGYGTYHALVIGNDKYRSVTPLKTAVHDATTVAGLLQEEYGFRVTLLVDATRDQMLDAFDELRRTLTETDNLLIYYAGHGHLDSDSDRGFWLPVDAESNRRAHWLSNSDLADFARASRAKHILVVADSCYAGTLTRSSLQMSALEDLSRLAQKRARTALVSGGLEPVEDAGGGQHSVFAKAFLDALRANTAAVDMSHIFSEMRRQVLLAAQQTPQYGDIRQTGHDGGDFIFVRQNQTPK